MGLSPHARTVSSPEVVSTVTSMLSHALSFSRVCVVELALLLLQIQYDIVVHRANHLLNNGFGRYDTLKNNCEDFAIYCKTGLLVLDERTMGQSGQADSLVSGLSAVVCSAPLRLFTTINVYTIGATALKVYCESWIAADIGMRSDVVRVSVEDLTTRLAADALQITEPSLPELLPQAR